MIITPEIASLLRSEEELYLTDTVLYYCAYKHRINVLKEQNLPLNEYERLVDEETQIYHSELAKAFQERDPVWKGYMKSLG